MQENKVKKLEIKEGRWDLGEGSWELEKGDGKGDGRKEKNDKLDNPKKSHKKMGRQGIVKEHFSSSRSLQNEPQNIPLQGVLIFCCHKCHTIRYKTLNKRKIE